MNILILLFGAVVLDLLIGDPSWIPHPVESSSLKKKRFCEKPFRKSCALPEKSWQ